MQEDSLWRLCPVQDIDTFLTSRYGDNNALSLLYCDLYMRQFKESLKKTMLEQESVFEDQIHELHRLYQMQKELMMKMEGTNNIYSQPRHLFLNARASSPRASIHWMGSAISTSKTSVLPPDDASAKIDEAGFFGDESDKSGEKVLEKGLKNGQVHQVLNFAKDQSPRSIKSAVHPENVQHSSALLRSNCILDLNEPAKIEEHSDYELNQFLSPAQTRSERAESQAQDPDISAKSQVENEIDLNMSPLSTEQVTTFKEIESEQPSEIVSASLHGKQGSVPSQLIVQALPCSKSISLSHKRSSWPRKKRKRGAKSTTAESVPRRKSRKGSNLDSNYGVNEDDNHSLSTTSYMTESDHNQERLEKGSSSSLSEIKPARILTSSRKRRSRKPHIDSGKDTIARTKSKTRGSFLVTEEEEQAAAEAIVDMSLSESAGNSNMETSNWITPLRWFANIASSVVEAKTLQLTEMKRRHKRTTRRQQKHEDHHNEILPSLSTFIGKETNDAHSRYCSLMENTVIDWGTITKRRRGIRIPKHP
ncbi:uncharacterized protein LOC18011924 isoform X1 [Eutrema salsugineum]|uniref:uncharacterized protein LOC18011924 isoform X1 n=2 Tax=Eutrema salsugineum TaxID=72664 RepID=UPI000CED4746|nr:uncharacterized protein LOC18011924 isoform X1 [Eutrema salsugineum]